MLHRPTNMFSLDQSQCHLSTQIKSNTSPTLNHHSNCHNYSQALGKHKKTVFFSGIIPKSGLLLSQKNSFFCASLTATHFWRMKIVQLPHLELVYVHYRTCVWWSKSSYGLVQSDSSPLEHHCNCLKNPLQCHQLLPSEITWPLK